MNQDARLALSICKDIETISADIYFYYAELFAGQQDIRNLWEKTAFEERNHASLLKLAHTWKSLELLEKAYDLPKLRNFKNVVQSIFDNVRRSKPTLGDALRSSIQLEKKLQEVHLENVVVFKNQAEEKLFASLLSAEKDHLTALEDAYRSVLRTGGFSKPMPAG